MATQTAPDLVLGTAGHIDHGKSSLIMALTGINCDRLAEEQKRGITIELGFAKLALTNGKTMGVVDVPGHEKFVRQMIAGATGIDIALLVIAADDGVMPQTKEHVAVLQTLGVKRVIVALTKSDMVEEEWLELMKEEVAAFLSNTPYCNAPIQAVSSKTGEGLEELREIITQASEEAEPLHQSRCMRQPIDRVFTIKGAGTVITGTLWSGTAKVEDTLEILPSRKTCRIRSVQMHDTSVKEAPAGNRVALNLADVKTDEVRPGDFLATPGLINPTRYFDTFFTYLDTSSSGKPLVNGALMHIAHGTKEVLGRIFFANGMQTLANGASTYAQVRLEERLPVSYGDRFIVRTYSPVHVAGGGEVLLAHPRKRTTLAEEIHVLDALSKGEVKAAIETMLGLQNQPLSAHDIAQYVGIDDESAAEYLSASIAEQAVEKLGTKKAFFIVPAAKDRAFNTIEQALQDFHKQNPSEAGVAKEALRQLSFPRMDPLCFDYLLNEALAKQLVVISDGLIGHPSAQGVALKIEQETAEKLLKALCAYGVTPPELKELAKENGVDISLARRALARLLQEDRVYRVSSELFYDGECIRACKQRIIDHFEKGGKGSIGELRDLIGASRKFAVPLLEAFDREHFTTRDGDERKLVK